MVQEVNVHSSLEFKIIAIYPSMEKPGKLMMLVSYPDLSQKVLYIDNPINQLNQHL